ncbi:histone acetyltransferases subunit 3-domain-containing protein [Lineolata rhizophorae]|uniref:Histone acetyltransferases subunit 3-domain-containing protein n=1 Tax=Lineolata rhizophorae TaxID=578093 RepID=A0A6A6NQ31_9PEZI|nr:histone acetyltransferases subunit 3-domain-containing protein [Lineolata rhizophorae]
MSSPISAPPPSAGLKDPRQSSVDSDASQQPKPAPAVPQYQTFGPDPLRFDDPTVYHIRDLTDDMPEEEKKEILCVAEYPHSDLHDLTCGTPPDKDFSNAKPTNQVNANLFASFVEPYIRPLAEEDMAFLRERGDRVTPFIMPRRGPKHYKQIWAEEDGLPNSAAIADAERNRLPPNEPRGDIDMMNDEVAETEKVSTGPVLARLLSVMRPEHRSADGAPLTNGEPNGTTTANGGDAMDIDGGGPGGGGAENQTNGDVSNLPPAAQLPDSSGPKTNGATSGSGGSGGGSMVAAVARTDYAAVEERLMGELRHIGILSDEDGADFSTHTDDEVAARLRYLQAELRRQSIVNGARKARILELTEARLAGQEYSTIADDLDAQLNQAYLKRNRNIGKGKKNAKRPGGAGTGAGAHGAAGTPGVAQSISRPSVGEPIRDLMRRRDEWIGKIGPVVDYGRQVIPKESIFGEEVMRGLAAREEEGWGETEDV